MSSSSTHPPPPLPSSPSPPSRTTITTIDPPRPPQLKYADVGINLGDPVFQGIYHNGKRAHESDLKDVIQRATDVGCRKMMVTGSDLVESRKGVQLAEEYCR
jgi:TatD DNase family protein